MSFMDDSPVPPPDDNLVNLKEVRLEKALTRNLKSALDNFQLEGNFTVRLVNDPHTVAELEEGLEASSDPLMRSLVGSLVETIERTVAETTGESVGAIRVVVNPGFSGLPDEDSHTDESSCDYIVGKMRCISCGHVSDEDRSTRCESYFCEDLKGRDLRIGDEVAVSLEHLTVFYHALNKQDDTEATHIVEGWECPECFGLNWAEVVLRHNRIESIWSIRLTHESLQRAHFVTSECIEVAASMVNRPSWELDQEEIIRILLGQPH